VPELYDLAADPGETTNRFRAKPERARTLGALLRDTSRSCGAAARRRSESTLDADATQRLKALGYVTRALRPCSASTPTPTIRSS
jgi:hypothetical protein